MISAIVLDSLQAATLLFIIFIENGCGVLSDKVQRPFGQRKLLSIAHCLKSVFGGFLSVKHAFLHFIFTYNNLNDEETIFNSVIIILNQRFCTQWCLSQGI